MATQTYASTPSRLGKATSKTKVKRPVSKARSAGGIVAGAMRKTGSSRGGY